MMKEQWDPSTPIIYLFSKIQDGVDKSDAGYARYTVNTVLAIAFNRVYRTDTMQSACECWTSLPPMNKTWANFQDMFTSAHENYFADCASRRVSQGQQCPVTRHRKVLQ
jgi:hypothetical protein